MKRLILISLFLISCGFAFSQEAVKAKLGYLGVKSYLIKDKPAAGINSVYTFNENGAKGGIIVFTLKGIKLDVFATILSTPNGYIVKSLEPVSNGRYGKKEMGQLQSSFSKWSDIREGDISDAVTSATKHSRGIYKETQDAVLSGISFLKLSSQ